MQPLWILYSISYRFKKKNSQCSVNLVITNGIAHVIFGKIQFDNIFLYILNVVVFVATRVKSENMKVVCIPTSFQVW